MLAVLGQLLDHGAHPREVGVAGVGRRRVDADEEQPRRIEQLVHVGGEGEPLGVAAAAARSRPGSWIVTSPRESDSTFSWRMSRAIDRVAELGEAGGGDQADPADSDHPDRLSLLAHRFFPPCFGFFFGMITSAERAIPTIWSLVRVCSRSLEIQ